MTAWYTGYDGVEYPNTEAGVDSGPEITREEWEQMTPSEQASYPEFLEETPEQERAREEQEAAFRLYLDISPLITKQTRRAAYWEGEGPEPMGALEQALERALKEVREIKTHQHQWNEDDYCDICGRDGRV